MRILGIMVREESRFVVKNLRAGWFPFGNYDKPFIDDYVKLLECDEQRRKERDKKLYHLKGDNTPEISVCCIAGRNGSGKSTLLDLMFRILNNLSFKLLIERKVTTIEWAYGVYADLHFETDGIPGYICNYGNDLQLYWGYAEHNRKKQIDFNNSDFHEVLHNLFYTICINYSIYSFHVEDYQPSKMELGKVQKGINGKWLEQMFHKNDGYLMPVVLAPFRDKEGNIDMGRERKLAMQRLTTLILFFHLNGKQFIEGYYPNELIWSFDKKYLSRSIDSLNKNWLGFTKKSRLEHMLSDFYQRWQVYFESHDMPRCPIGDNMRKVVLRYLAYKSLKICCVYSDYATIYNNRTEKPSIRIDAVIKKIVSEVDHITVKIHQCLHYANEKMYSSDFSHQDVNDLFGKYMRNVKSYDEMMGLLPPSFFSTDLYMRKKKVCPEHRTVFGLDESFRLSTMSSGERQFLNSVSYALYHVKNIEGVRDGENRVHYNHINLVLDEVELYYHPEYQRRYVKMLLETLSWCNFSRNKIKSINIIIVTHSPFILSDIVNDNVLYLEDGAVKKQEKETFGANYYDMLYNSFFFEKNAIGEVAAGVISDLINHPEEMTETLKDILGDPIIRGYLINKRNNNVLHQVKR